MCSWRVGSSFDSQSYLSEHYVDGYPMIRITIF